MIVSQIADNVVQELLLDFKHKENCGLNTLQLEQMKEADGQRGCWMRTRIRCLGCGETQEIPSPQDFLRAWVRVTSQPSCEARVAVPDPIDIEATAL